jgi:hypothetical protein
VAIRAKEDKVVLVSREHMVQTQEGFSKKIWRLPPADLARIDILGPELLLPVKGGIDSGCATWKWELIRFLFLWHKT